MTAPAQETVRTEFAFTLPVGYLDANGTAHREGRMRLATARDEILPLRDPRVQDNEAYLTVIRLSDLHPGMHVVIRGQANPDGSITASSITADRP